MDSKLLKHVFLFILLGLMLTAWWSWAQADEPKPVETQSGLQYLDLVKGNGREAHVGETAIVHYTGWLTDGTKFDSSVDRDQPFSFQLGKGRVIKGWDEGLTLMNKGTKAFLFIPAELGYGAQDSERIPANSELIFYIEVEDIK